MLRTREALLVLDNFEHVRAAAPVLVELMSHAPRLTLLVTSRVVLHVSGEHVYPVEPLAEDAASELFVMRAREADAHLELGEADAEAIRGICRRLDGLPLAIELAAGRTRTLTPAELLSGLEQRLPLLTGGPRDLPARQRTLRATLEWSFGLLDELEQLDLARLSVFRGRFTAESAAYVADTTLERLSALVDHNLVVRTVTPHGSRYFLLETISELASEQLDTFGEVDDTHRRLAERMIAIAEAAHVSEDADEPFHWPVGQAEPEDLRAALDWAIDGDPTLGLELACAYENFWGPHAPVEGVRRVQDLLARADRVSPRLRARALRNIAGAAHQERDFGVAVPAYEESLRIYNELGDLRGAISNRMRLAYCAMARQEYDVARELLHGALRDARGAFPTIQGQGVTLLAHLALFEGRIDDAEAALDESEALAAGGWKWYVSLRHRQRLAVALARGDLDEAERQGRAGLVINIEQKHAPATTQDSLAGLARVAFLKGDLERAGLLWGAILVQGEHRLGTLAARWREELRAETRPEFLAALERGAELDLWEAAALVLDDEPAG
jgi:predicted ATPase